MHTSHSTEHHDIEMYSLSCIIVTDGIHEVKVKHI